MLINVYHELASLYRFFEPDSIASNLKNPLLLEYQGQPGAVCSKCGAASSQVPKRCHRPGPYDASTPQHHASAIFVSDALGTSAALMWLLEQIVNGLSLGAIATSLCKNYPLFEANQMDDNLHMANEEYWAPLKDLLLDPDKRIVVL